MLGKVDIVMGAFSKTFASNGGFVACAARGVKRQLQLFAGPHLFSNALSPLQASIILECLGIVASSEGAALRAQLMSNVEELRRLLADAGLRRLGTPSAIVPVLVGRESVSRLAGKLLAREGLFANQVEYPGVPLGAARLRLQLMANHSLQQVRHGARIISACVAEARTELALAACLGEGVRG
jgi:7-keto-8-aminopelargonate synthetase-like enzyme